MDPRETKEEEVALSDLSQERPEAVEQEETPAKQGGTLGMSVENLSAFYGSFKAVTDVNIDLRPHTITALIGPSGCGKSTFIRCLNRMHEVIPEAYAKGCIKLGDQDIYAKNTDPVSIRRRIGMVFQKPNPFSKSIYENVAGEPGSTATETTWTSW